MTSNQQGSSTRERFLFLGSGLAVALALLIGMAREQGWGTRYVPLQLRVTNAEGLRAGQEVRISGMPVGRLRSLQLLPDATVQVHLQVRQQAAGLIGPRSVASLGQEGLVGDHFLVISADPRPQDTGGARPGQRLPYVQPLAIDNLMHRLLGTQMALQRTLESTNRLTAKDVPLTLQEMRRGLTGLQQLTTTLDRQAVATAPQLRQSLGSVQRLSTSLDRQTTATGPLLRRTLEQVERTGRSAEQTSQQAQQLLRQGQPLLIGSLQELEALTRRINGLLQDLLGLKGNERREPPATAEPRGRP